MSASIDFPKTVSDKARASGELLRVPIDDVVRSLARDEPFDDDGLVNAFAVAGRDLEYVERRLIPVAEFADLNSRRIPNKEFGRGLITGLDLVERKKVGPILIAQRQIVQQVLDRRTIDVRITRIGRDRGREFAGHPRG